MTAEDIITNIASTAITGTKIADTSIPANKTKLLHLLNLGIKQLAQDALLWMDGETITLVAGTYEYALATTPIQIIDIYDEDDIVRPRNDPDYYGYYQTTPNTIRFNNVTDGKSIYVNYYVAPDDYALTDTVTISPALINALSYFIASKVVEFYRSTEDNRMSKLFYNDYVSSLQAYLFATDSVNPRTLVNTDLITNKGLV